LYSTNPASGKPFPPKSKRTKVAAWAAVPTAAMVSRAATDPVRIRVDLSEETGVFLTFVLGVFFL
jgi:hypothetical protein